jgi:transposase
MRAYSTDLRERIVAAVASGRTQREAARVFGVAVSTVKNYLRQHQQTGRLERAPIPGRTRRIGPEQEAALRVQVSAQPTASLAELCGWWAQTQGQAVSLATMSRAIHRLGMTRKKGRWWPASATRRRGPRGGR